MSNPDKIEIYKELQKELEERKNKVRLHTEDFLTIDYDLNYKWLYAHWIGPQTEETLEEGFTLLLEILREMESCKVLIDHSEMTGDWMGAADWVRSIWLPQSLQAGLQYLAWVHSSHLVAQAATEAVIHEPLPVDIRLFHRLEEARAWLKEIPEP